MLVNAFVPKNATMNRESDLERHTPIKTASLVENHSTDERMKLAHLFDEESVAQASVHKVLGAKKV